MPTSAKESAREVLEVVPLVMRSIRTEMRGSGTLNLSVPQFRALNFVNGHPGTSLSDVAEHIGLTLPSMSKLIDGLVERKLITRQSHADDRRCLTLELTTHGCTLLRSARASTQTALAARMSALDESERATVVRAMRILYPLFAHCQAGVNHDNLDERKSC